MKKIAVIGLSGQSIMIKVDRFASEGETIVIKDAYFEAGGKGFNQAVCLANLGANVVFCSSVGEDEYAKLCYDKLIEKKVKPFYIYKQDKTTAFATVVTNSQGENKVSVYQGAASLLSIEDITSFEDEIKSSSFLLVQLEQNINTTRKIIELANKYNVPTILNPAPAREYDLELLQKADIITPNELEAKTIFSFDRNDSNDELLQKLNKLNLKRVIITLGKDGLIVVSDNVVNHLKAHKVQVLDSTGAGDAFNAGLVYALSKDYPPLEAARFASIVASLSVSKKGVIASFPNLAEVMRIYQDVYLK